MYPYDVNTFLMDYPEHIEKHMYGTVASHNFNYMMHSCPIFNGLNKTESAVFLYCRFFLYLKDPFFPELSKQCKIS